MSEETRRPEPAWPTRDITDPKELRALAHPVRFALLDLLIERPMTATECAERLGETPANCSYHLRQLAKYGHVIEAGGGKGRERRWTPRKEGIRWEPADAQGGAQAVLGEALEDVVDEHRFSAWRGYRAARVHDDDAWRRASLSMDVVAWMTAEELTEVNQRIFDTFAPFVARDESDEARPDGARPVRFFAYGWGGPR